jgi:transmembrane sensor
MKQYETYTVEDFVMDDDFRDWVQGDNRQETFWKGFLQAHPEKQTEVRMAEQLIRVLSVAPERMPDQEIREEVHGFLEVAQPLSEEQPTRRVPWGTLAAAALVLLALSLGWFSMRQQNVPGLAAFTSSTSANQLAVTYNDSPKPLKILLNDGTQVVLSPKSRLRYPSQFTDSSRSVYLTGEAAFAVTRNARPFLVHAGEMVTKVLGTRFVVRAFEADKKYSVQVQSGRVSVYATQADRSTSLHREVNGLILTANQAAIFETAVRQLTKTVVANPALLKVPAATATFAYDEVPLPTVLRELELHYGIPIQFDRQSFRSCAITATLASETLYEKLDMLCKTVSASYEIVDGQIVISGKGCE